MDARAAGDDAGGVSGEIEALRRSAMASSDDGRLEALSNLGHKLAWLCRIKYLDTMWWSPAGQRAEDAGRNRNASTSSDVDTGDEVGRYVPKTPAAEALLALLVFLDEERSLVAPKGRSKHQLVRSAVLPLLLYAGRAKGACEFLSVAENASGCHEGIDTFVRWELLACACIEAKLPGRAVRVTRSLLDEGFELPEAEERTSRHEGCGGDDDGGPTASRAPNREDDPLSSLFQPSDGARKVRLLLLACRAKLDEHRMQMREHAFNGGSGAAVATGWAEKALDLCKADPNGLGHLRESCATAYAGCILETLSRGHQGNPSCSPPREVHDRALLECESELRRVVHSQNARSPNPIATYLLALTYVRRGKRQEAMELLSGLQHSNSSAQVFMTSLLAVLHATQKRTAKGFNMLERLLCQLEALGGGNENLEKQFFVHRVQLKFSIFKRGATTMFQRGRHRDHEDLLDALEARGRARLASLLAAELAMHHSFCQKFDRARVLAERAVQIDPSCPLAHHALGTIHEGRSEYGEALRKYEEAMAMCPQYGPSALASALIWEYQMDDYTWHARDLCEDALKWNLDDCEARLALGRLMEQLGERESSKALIATGLREIGEMPCVPLYEFPIVLWEDDLSLDCFSF